MMAAATNTATSTAAGAPRRFPLVRAESWGGRSVRRPTQRRYAMSPNHLNNSVLTSNTTETHPDLNADTIDEPTITKRSLWAEWGPSKPETAQRPAAPSSRSTVDRPTRPTFTRSRTSSSKLGLRVDPSILYPTTSNRDGGDTSRSLSRLRERPAIYSGPNSEYTLRDHYPPIQTPPSLTTSHENVYHDSISTPRGGGYRDANNFRVVSSISNRQKPTIGRRRSVPNSSYPKPIIHAANAPLSAFWNVSKPVRRLEDGLEVRRGTPDVSDLQVQAPVITAGQVEWIKQDDAVLAGDYLFDLPSANTFSDPETLPPCNFLNRNLLPDLSSVYGTFTQDHDRRGGPLPDAVVHGMPKTDNVPRDPKDSGLWTEGGNVVRDEKDGLETWLTDEAFMLKVQLLDR